MWHWRADCVNAVSCHHMCHDIRSISSWDSLLLFQSKLYYQMISISLISMCERRNPAECGRTTGADSVAFEKETRGEPNICCGVYQMLTSQRWVDGKQRCPVGIKIYLSQVTPIGNKQLDSSLCHSHTHSLSKAYTLHIPTSVAT